MTKAFIQMEGLDYIKSFFSVIPFESLPLLVEKFVSNELYVRHVRISAVFLNGDIDVDPFVAMDGDVYKLKQSLYGLKQSCWFWYEMLKS